METLVPEKKHELYQTPNVHSWSNTEACSMRVFRLDHPSSRALWLGGRFKGALYVLLRAPQKNEATLEMIGAINEVR